MVLSIRLWLYRNSIEVITKKIADNNNNHRQMLQTGQDFWNIHLIHKYKHKQIDTALQIKPDCYTQKKLFYKNTTSEPEVCTNRKNIEQLFIYFLEIVYVRTNKLRTVGKNYPPHWDFSSTFNENQMKSSNRISCTWAVKLLRGLKFVTNFGVHSVQIDCTFKIM